MIQYRNLSENEIHRALFAHFIRRQQVTKCWRKEKGEWVIREAPFVDDWTEKDFQTLVICLKDTAAAGGFVHAAFSDGDLKGFAAVLPGFFGGGQRYLDLASIHVSEDMRGQGIGKALFLKAKDWAVKKGAKKLYISAHSCVESQAFYKKMGCVEAQVYNRKHVEEEPYDCQLECSLETISKALLPFGNPGGDLLIRPAVPEDAENILAVYEYYVRYTAISFEYEVPTVEAFRARIENTLKKYPYFVAVLDGKIVGYAYAGPFVGRAAYGWSAEAAIYIDADRKKQGIGRKLYGALEGALKQMGILNLYACIGYPETEDEYLTRNSVDFHARMGYAKAGEFHYCGRKFGRWYHMVWMEKMLGSHKKEQEPVIFPEQDIPCRSALPQSVPEHSPIRPGRCDSDIRR